MTAGIFISIAARASYQRDNDETPYWRTLKTDEELNTKYPAVLRHRKKSLNLKAVLSFRKAGKISDTL